MLQCRKLKGIQGSLSADATKRFIKRQKQYARAVSIIGHGHFKDILAFSYASVIKGVEGGGEVNGQNTLLIPIPVVL